MASPPWVGPAFLRRFASPGSFVTTGAGNGMGGSAERHSGCALDRRGSQLRQSSGAMHPLAALRRLPRYPLEAFFWTRAADLGRHAARLPRLRGPVRPAAPHRRRRGRGRARRRLGGRRLGALGQRLVPRDRPSRLRRPGPLDRVLPGLPAARPGRRLVLPRPRPARRRARLAPRLGGRLRPALEARGRRCSGARRRSQRPLPGDLPDDALPRRRLQRVALPRAHGRGVPRRRHAGAGPGPASRPGSRR